MDRYLRALDAYMQDVRRFQEGGQVTPEISDENIRRFARGKTDKQIARVMMRLGVSVERLARALNKPVEQIEERLRNVLPDVTVDLERLEASRVR
jgi:hypothetical protein